MRLSRSTESVRSVGGCACCEPPTPPHARGRYARGSSWTDRADADPSGRAHAPASPGAGSDRSRPEYRTHRRAAVHFHENHSAPRLGNSRAARHEYAPRSCRCRTGRRGPHIARAMTMTEYSGSESQTELTAVSKQARLPTFDPLPGDKEPVRRRASAASRKAPHRLPLSQAGVAPRSRRRDLGHWIDARECRLPRATREPSRTTRSVRRGPLPQSCHQPGSARQACAAPAGSGQAVKNAATLGVRQL